MTMVGSQAGFTHAALLYASDEEYLAGVLPFIEEGLASGQPVLVVVPAARQRLIEHAIGSPAGLTLRPMERVGRNPAWIIPAWAEFLADHVGTPVRGVGEPIWPARSDDELSECVRHEALLNLAFAEAEAFTLLCPYDVAGLEAEVVEAAGRTHPAMCHRGDVTASAAYSGPELADDPLPPAPADAAVRTFDRDGVPAARRWVASIAEGAGLDPARVSDLVVAVSEALTNSVVHGGGGGRLAAWVDGRAVVCEIIDAGRIEDPLAGRVRPTLEAERGRGLWIINQLCDLVQVRATDAGQRIRFRLSA